MLRPIFKRLGCKYSMLQFILPLIPPHKTYIEPFFGSGVVFFNKPEQGEKNIINDADTLLITDYKIIAKAPIDLFEHSFKARLTLKEIESIYWSTEDSNTTSILKAIIRNNNGFNGRPVTKKIYKAVNPNHKSANFPFYVNTLNKATILNKSYQDVIKAYDSDDSFFYLDPPYEEGNFKKVYDHYSKIDYIELRDILRSIKGKFLLSLNSSANIEELFQEFSISAVLLNTQAGRTNREPRWELLISNYISL